MYDYNLVLAIKLYIKFLTRLLCHTLFFPLFDEIIRPWHNKNNHSSYWSLQYWTILWTFSITNLTSSHFLWSSMVKISTCSTSLLLWTHKLTLFFLWNSCSKSQKLTFTHTSTFSPSIRPHNLAYWFIKTNHKLCSRRFCFLYRCRVQRKFWRSFFKSLWSFKETSLDTSFENFTWKSFFGFNSSHFVSKQWFLHWNNHTPCCLWWKIFNHFYEIMVLYCM